MASLFMDFLLQRIPKYAQLYILSNTARHATTTSQDWPKTAAISTHRRHGPTVTLVSLVYDSLANMHCAYLQIMITRCFRFSTLWTFIHLGARPMFLNGLYHLADDLGTSGN